MSKIALLEIDDGNFETGFKISLQIVNYQSRSIVPRITGNLPPNPDLERLYICWQDSFRHLRIPKDSGKFDPNNPNPQRGNYDDWEIDHSVVTNLSINEEFETCQEFVNLFEDSMKKWLDASFSDMKKQIVKIRESLVVELAKSNEQSESSQIIIQTRDTMICKLYWYAWDLLIGRLDVGISFILLGESSPSSSQTEPPLKPKQKIRVLAIFGDSYNINLDKDWQAIHQLREKGAEIIPLNKPTRQELIEKIRDPEGWHIFFFAGHSNSNQEDSQGKIYINERESLGIDQFKSALIEARGHGLQIAIFNSCKGLGLVTQLSALQIPFMIVMQDVVPDKVAQFFLQEFLQEYSGGKVLHIAVRLAQTRLERYLPYLPGASWLPVMFQSRIPIGIPPLWSDFLIPQSENYVNDKILPKPIKFRKKPKLYVVLIVGLLVTMLVLGVRSLGLLETCEFWAYDIFMKYKPSAPVDERITVVAIDDNDISLYGKPVKDQTITKLLTELEKYKPKVIGLDIERDQPTYSKAEWEALGKHIQASSIPIIAVCAVGDNPRNEQFIESKAFPYRVSAEKIGFSDSLIIDPPIDNNTGLGRRYVLSMYISEHSDCPTGKSFSLKLVESYISDSYKIFFDDEKGYLSPAQATSLITTLKVNHGGYKHQPNDYLQGRQILINYSREFKRGKGIPLEFAMKKRSQYEESTFSELIAHKIVIIGYENKKSIDIHNTPVGEIYGVWINATVVSDLLNYIEDGILLLSPWSESWENLAIFSTSILAAYSTSLYFFSLDRLIIVLLIEALSLFIVGFIYFNYGVWIPIIPILINLGLTSLMVYFYSSIMSYIDITSRKLLKVKFLNLNK